MPSTDNMLSLGLAALVALAALTLAAPAAMAGEDNTTGEVSIAVIGFVERDPNDSAKFEEYREVPSGLVLDHVLFSWWGDGKGFVDLEMFDAVQDAQRISFEAGRFDLFKVSIDWTEIPYNWSDRAVQVHTYQGSEHGLAYFSLPDQYQQAVAGMTAAERAAAIGDLVLNSGFMEPASKHRETGSADFRFFPSRNTIVGFAVSRERRDGNTWVRSGNFARSEAALPIDYVTDGLQVYAEINKRHWRLGGRIDWTEFDTGTSWIRWDNLRGTNEFAMSGEVDHESMTWTLDGGFRLAGDTSINWLASQGTVEADQDIDPFLLAGGPFVPDRFRGEYDSNLYSLKIDSQPIDWFGIKAWWRTYEYDNDTTSFELDDRWTLQQGYEKTQYGLALTFSPADWVDIIASYENVDMDREDAAFESSDEDIFTLALDFDVNQHVFIRAKYRWLDRDMGNGNPFYLVEDAGLPADDINPAERRFYWSDREREEISLIGDFTINDQFSIFAEALHATSDYSDPLSGQDVGTIWNTSFDWDDDGMVEPHSMLLHGRIDDTDEAYTLGFSVSSPEHRVSFAADYTWETWKWSLASRARPDITEDPGDNWFSDMEDDYETFHMSFDARLDGGGLWRLLADLTWSSGEGRIKTTEVPGGVLAEANVAAQFPETETELTIFTLAVNRKLGQAWEVGIEYWYEQWEETDWQFDYWAPWLGDVDPNLGEYQFLGRDYHDYENHVISLLATFKF